MRKQLPIPFLPLLPSLALLACILACPGLACQGAETTGQQQSLICSSGDVPVYRNRFAPQPGASGVATAPEAVAGKISSDAPTGGTTATDLPLAGPAIAPTATDAGPPAETPPASAGADAGAGGGDAGSGLITAMIGSCGPAPCSAGQVAVEAPPKAPATTAPTTAPAGRPAAPAASDAPAATPAPASTTTLVCAPPPPSCPEGQSPQFTMKQTWECTDCSLVVTYGYLYGNYRRCVNMPHIKCPDGEVPTWVFEHEQWECKTKCDNGQYDQHLADGLLVCVPC